MSMTLGELAKLVGGTPRGQLERPIEGAAPLADAQPGQITLIDHADKIAQLSHSQAAAAIVPRGCPSAECDTIEVDDVHAAFATVICRFRPPRSGTAQGISPAAFVSPRARLAAGVTVHPGATIEDEVEIGSRVTVHAGARIMAGCRLGDDVIVHANAVLYPDTRVGARCVIHAGAVLGCDGFGYRFVAGRHVLSSQLGWVELEADVEVGANSTIDRGTYGATLIGEGTKIDNQVMIAHNCRIGKHNLLCSQVGIAGSTTTGDYVVMAGQVGVRDHVHIGTRAVLGAMAGVINDVPEGQTVIGIPATPEREQKIKQAALAKLPEMRKELRELQRTVARLAAGESREAA